MSAPLEYILGEDVSDDIDKYETHTTMRNGNAVNELFSKRCEEIKNKYGVPIGYSCIITRTQNIKYPAASSLHRIEEERDIDEINDDLFDTLFMLASTAEEDGAKKSKAPRKTKRVTQNPKKRRVTKNKTR